MPELLNAMADAVRGARHVAHLHLRFSEGKRRAWLFAQDIVQDETQTEDGFDITVRWSDRQAETFSRL